MDKSGPREAIIEFQQIGSIVKVIAVDPATGTEAVFQAPANTPRKMLEQTALSKLRYILNKK